MTSLVYWRSKQATKKREHILKSDWHSEENEAEDDVDDASTSTNVNGATPSTAASTPIHVVFQSI